MMRLGVSVILSKKCGAFDKRWIRRDAGGVVVVVAARALESNLIARSCFVLRSGGDVKITFVQLGLEQIFVFDDEFVLFLRRLGFCRLRKERGFIDDLDIIDDFFDSSSSRWRWGWRWSVSS